MAGQTLRSGETMSANSRPATRAIAVRIMRKAVCTAGTTCESSSAERLLKPMVPGTSISVPGTSITTDWRTGEPVAATLTVDPQGTGAGSFPEITFALGDALLFVDFEYQIGNSPAALLVTAEGASSGSTSGTLSSLP